MNDIVWTKSYEDYKAELGQEMMKSTESFVRIGYLLKVARDTDILNGSEYEGDYLLFAEKEYGLEKTQVSRFIRINDKYGKEGSQGELKDEYKGFGVKKLGIMLTLPDEIASELSPDLTAKEIEIIQAEVIEEQKQSPLEQYAETIEAETFPEENKAAKAAENSLLASVLYQIYDDVPELFRELHEARPTEYKRVFSPVPDTTYIAKVKGVGRLMLICKADELTVINARSNEKKKFTWEEWEHEWFALSETTEEDDAKKAWEEIFGREFPVVHESTTKEPEKKAEKKESRVKVTKEKKDAKKKPETAAKATRHEATGEGTGQESTDETGASLATAADEVHDLQPEGSAGENQSPGEEDLGGTAGEPLPSGTGEALSGEGSGASGGEGNTSEPAGRNKYSARLENLIYTSGILKKDLAAEQEDFEEAMKDALMIKQCIESIIGDIGKEPKKTWREVK